MPADTGDQISENGALVAVAMGVPSWLKVTASHDSNVRGIFYGRRFIEGLQKNLTPTDLKKDLETVQALYNENVVTASEREVLKQKLLEIGKK